MATQYHVPKGDDVVAVTGASGYIAAHVVQQLLEAGYTVRGTVRDPTNEKKTAFLKEIAAKANASDRLKLYKADLLEEGSFDEVVDGATYVLHTASPFLIDNISDPQKQLIDPAVKGTTNVLNSVNKSHSVKRVVVTSSCAAIYGSNDDKPQGEVFTEDDWNVTSDITTGAYSLSKRLAEEAAWDMCNAQERWDLCTINPAMVMGPPLSKNVGSSIKLMQRLCGGEMYYGAPDFGMGVVDVRDVARAHIVVMKVPTAKGRHIMSPESMSFVTMGKLLKEKYGMYKLPSGALPKWLLYLVGPLVGLSWHFITHNIGYNIVFSVDKMRNEHNFEFRPVKKALEDMVEAMIELGQLPDKRQ